MRQLSDNAKATLMLCSRIGIGTAVAPYSNAEWNKLAEKLLKSELKEPAGLLGITSSRIATILDVKMEEAERIESLVSRGVNMAFYLDDLDRKAIYPITRGDADYPIRLRKVLGNYAPPVLYGCGDIRLANRIGIAMVGSRNVDSETEAYAVDLAKWVVAEGLTVFSGGAKGIDQITEKAALSMQGCSVCFLADSMFKRLKDPHTVNAIMNGKLLLLSSVSPDAPFSVGTAMGRNKYIYALSRAAFVIASSFQEGGTWNGAVENLKAGWVRTFVWNTSKYPGNIPLLAKGALAIPPQEDGVLQSLLADMPVKSPLISKNQAIVEQMDLFSMEREISTSIVHEGIISEGNSDGLQLHESGNLYVGNDSSAFDGVPPLSEVVTTAKCNELLELHPSVYSTVLPLILYCLDKPKTTEQLAIELDVTKTQLAAWLSSAVKAGDVRKLRSPVRYDRVR